MCAYQLRDHVLVGLAILIKRHNEVCLLALRVCEALIESSSHPDICAHTVDNQVRPTQDQIAAREVGAVVQHNNRRYLRCERLKQPVQQFLIRVVNNNNGYDFQ